MFKWNAISSTYHNLEVINILGKYSMPKKQYQSIEVPGRTGNLLIDTGARLNKQITIECCLVCTGLDDIRTAAKLKEVQEWLLSPIGYKILEFPDGTKFNAIVSDVVDVVHRYSNNIFTMTLIFECYEVSE